MIELTLPSTPASLYEVRIVGQADVESRMVTSSFDQRQGGGAPDANVRFHVGIAASGGATPATPTYLFGPTTSGGEYDITGDVVGTGDETHSLYISYAPYTTPSGQSYSIEIYQVDVSVLTPFTPVPTALRSRPGGARASFGA